RDVFSLGHTDEVAQMPKFHRANPRSSVTKILIPSRYKAARKSLSAQRPSGADKQLNKSSRTILTTADLTLCARIPLFRNSARKSSRESAGREELGNHR